MKCKISRYEYAGKVYGGALDAQCGVGIELPTRYFQLLAHPQHLVHEPNPKKANSASLLYTLAAVMQIFYPRP